MSNGLPPYVPYDGLFQGHPPYIAQGLGTRSFLLLGAYAKAEELCDRYLNIAPPEVMGFEWRPLWIPGLNETVVYMQVNTYPYFASKVPEFRDRGFTTFNEIAFGLPVFKYVPDHLLPRQVALFMPYVFVDLSSSLIGGREVYGYPKLMADFQIPEDIADPYPTRVETQVYVTFSPTSTLTTELLAEITAGEEIGKEIPPNPWPWGPIGELYAANAEYPVEKDQFDLMKESSGLHCVQLKEFRDAQELDHACYQAIVDIELKLKKSHRSGRLTRAAIRIPDYASLSIVENLGLENTNGAIRSVFQFWYRVDLELTEATNLFSRPC